MKPSDPFHTEKCKRAFLKESSSNPRRMLAGFFLKKVVFSFSESGLFFSFSLFFVLTCCKLGALDFIILLRFHSNRIIQTRIFLYVCKNPRRRCARGATKAPASPAFPAVVAAAASAAASETSRRRRHAAFGLRTQNSNQHILYGCRVGNSK